MISFIETDFSHSDERGSLIQLCRDGWKQINICKSHRGTFRGDHYHTRNREAFFIIYGQIDMRLEKDGEVKELSAAQGDFFVIEPHVRHSFSYPEDTLTVALYDIGVENSDGTKDIHSR
ncbi:MAG: cupin domain-containing protein [Mailhella sp.]|nr:cupin domain-containing protein [Mailhella sp.]